MPNLTPELVALGAIWYIVFLFSTTCHEAAHALAAKWGGDSTAYHGGQVTLNPLPHILREPVGMVVVPLITLHFRPLSPVTTRKHSVSKKVLGLAAEVLHSHPSL